MSKERDDAFESWWEIEDDKLPWFIKLRDDVRKQDAKRIWDAAFKAGGASPWWSITQTQWAVLNEKLGDMK